MDKQTALGVVLKAAKERAQDMAFYPPRRADAARIHSAIEALQNHSVNDPPTSIDRGALSDPSYGEPLP